ncbi:hypothetical protein B0T26DRAFT_144385 [Lasiosphaeria miniovina]|uniref:Secreted protein n=1 Tax=Lasiosphaeria miniovina TaxID=1954250 RepID=A0AA40B4X9_9PEZI|nr:uncharacterized protein B0T26DRAFT_144385 [Lasiosphaeria miniovina]KAK0727756.1 hypothetical protein B0T26DRAFT_144385 [Lasiosphaeria miniovina]
MTRVAGSILILPALTPVFARSDYIHTPHLTAHLISPHTSSHHTPHISYHTSPPHRDVPDCAPEAQSLALRHQPHQTHPAPGQEQTTHLDDKRQNESPNRRVTCRKQTGRPLTRRLWTPRRGASGWWLAHTVIGSPASLHPFFFRFFISSVAISTCLAKKLTPERFKKERKG